MSAIPVLKRRPPTQAHYICTVARLNAWSCPEMSSLHPTPIPMAEGAGGQLFIENCRNKKRTGKKKSDRAAFFEHFNLGV